MAKGLVAELAQKVGVPMGGGVEAVVCDRLRDFVADLKEENKPEAHTLRYSLLAAVCDPDDTRRVDNQAGVIRQKEYATQSLTAVGHRLGVKDEAMYKAKRRRISWGEGMPWLASIQPQATNHKALGREEREAIRMARDMGPGHVIVTILCDVGSRYQSKIYNPAFMRAKGLPVPAWLEEKADVPSVLAPV